MLDSARDLHCLQTRDDGRVPRNMARDSPRKGARLEKKGSRRRCAGSSSEHCRQRRAEGQAPVQALPRKPRRKRLRAREKNVLPQLESAIMISSNNMKPIRHVRGVHKLHISVQVTQHCSAVETSLTMPLCTFTIGMMWCLHVRARLVRARPRPIQNEREPAIIPSQSCARRE